MKISYCNTDLDLVGPNDLGTLGAVFATRGVPPLHVTRAEGGSWYATFETDKQHDRPEPNISAMLAVIESLSEAENAIWRSCTRREFNIGYECGNEPWAFNHGLSNDVLRRMAEAGTSLRLTLYPPDAANQSY